jgi:hypothetical protein
VLSSRLTFAGLTLASTLLVGCGSSSTTPEPEPPAQTPAITLAVTGGGGTVLQGETATYTATITRSGGFTGAVTVAVEGLPTGATATPATIAAGSTTGAITVTVGASATIGTAQLTFRATATGVTARTATGTITIAAPPAAGSYSLGTNPATLSVQAGQSGTSTITLTRTGGFDGAVALTATAPAGVTVSFAPASVTGTTSTATIAVAAGTAAGAGTVTIRGATTGQPERTTTMALTITAAPGGGGGGGGGTGNVTWSFCGSWGIPLWVAVQDGNGAWTRVTGTNNSYQFQISSGRGGIAYVVPEDTGFRTRVFYGTTAELTAQGNALCALGTGAAKTVTATVPGVTAGATALFSLGGAIANVAGPASALTFERVPSGRVDLTGGLSSFVVSGLNVTFVPSRFFIRRGLTPANNASLGALDFNGADGFAPEQATATLANANGEQIVSVMSMQTNGGTFGTFYSAAEIGSPASIAIYGVPSARRVGNDLHFLNVTATPATGPTNVRTRNIGLLFAAMGPKSVTFGAALSAPTVTSLGSQRTQVQLPVQAEYNRYWVFDLQQPNADRQITIEATGGWLGGGATLTLAMPNLSAVTGWNATWALNTGNTNWTVTATGWDAAGGITSTPFVDGALYRSATQQGEIGL